MVLPVLFGGGNSSSISTFIIQNSLRYRASGTTTMIRTPTITSNQLTWTISLWMKKPIVNSSVPPEGIQLFQAGYGGAISGSMGPSYYTGIRISGSGTYSDQIGLQWAASWNSVQNNVGNVCLRDPTAWDNLIMAVDLTQPILADRILIYKNGVLLSSSYSNLPQNQIGAINTAGQAHGLNTYAYQGTSPDGNNGPSDLYLADVNFVDGLALGPSYFGTVDPNNSDNWIPIDPSKVILDYGKNGFRLEFKNTSNFGLDTAPIATNHSSANNWTATNFTSSDQMVDTPTNNYPTLNPIEPTISSYLGNGALTNSAGSSNYYSTRSTIQLPSSGKFYAEFKYLANTTNLLAAGCGVCLPSVANVISSNWVGTAGLYGFYASSAGYIHSNGTTITSSLSSATSSDIIQVLADCTNGKVWIGKNNVFYDGSGGTTGNPSAGTNPTFTINPSGMLFYAMSNGIGMTANFGQTSFTYTPPTGFKSLCSNNMPTISIKNPSSYFNAIAYTGNGSTLSIANTINTPDMVWIKSRNNTTDWAVVDSVRGVSNDYALNNGSPETTQTSGVVSFGNNSISIGSEAKINTSASSYISYIWKKGATPGFDIQPFSTGTSTITVNHNLGATPNMIFIKDRLNGQGTLVYHSSVCTTTSDYFILDTYNPMQTSPQTWGTTLPNSVSFQVSPNPATNNSSNYIAYLWSSIPGFSSFGSYLGNGNGNDGPFCYCGFKPRFVMIKDITTGGAGFSWYIFDSTRNTYNPVWNDVRADANYAEEINNNDIGPIDFLSNGFKIRTAVATYYTNQSGDAYLWAAFAKSPFGGSNIKPSCAG